MTCQSLTGNNGDVVDTLGEDCVTVFQITRQMVQRARRSKGAGNGEEHDTLSSKKKS